MKNNYKIIDLFSGIGGFALASKMAFGNRAETIAFVEKDEFCQQVLKKNFQGVPIYDEIREYRPKKHSADIVCGGFPCQPFSQAGQRKGTADDRYLWDQMLRVIKETAPGWVIAENVYGLLTMQGGVVFGEIISDLESIGYEVETFVLPAVGKNAPHKRDRVWIVANAMHGNDGANTRSDEKKGEKERLQKRYEMEQSGEPSKVWDAKNSVFIRSGGWSKIIRQILDCKKLQIQAERSDSETGEDASDAESVCMEGFNARQGEIEFGRNLWRDNWLEVATEFCRMDDGLPARVDGLKLSTAGHRRKRLEALGNAIVPQVAMEIFKAIDFANNKEK